MDSDYDRKKTQLMAKEPEYPEGIPHSEKEKKSYPKSTNEYNRGWNDAVKKMSQQKEIEIESPIVHMEVDFGERFIFMWSGRTISQKEVPIEKMSVKELQKMSQEIIQKRNDSVMNEAFINRFII